MRFILHKPPLPLFFAHTTNNSVLSVENVEQKARAAEYAVEQKDEGEMMRSTGVSYRSLCASSLVTATIVSVVTISAISMDNSMATFSLGASNITTVS
jgi:hypothetical protein